MLLLESLHNLRRASQARREDGWGQPSNYGQPLNDGVPNGSTGTRNC
jgi:hypothetical protein